MSSATVASEGLARDADTARRTAALSPSGSPVTGIEHNLLYIVVDYKGCCRRECSGNELSGALAECDEGYCCAGTIGCRVGRVRV